LTYIMSMSTLVPPIMSLGPTGPVLNVDTTAFSFQLGSERSENAYIYI